MRDDFAVFILTNGRAGRVSTLRSLKRAGYTGKAYLIVDDEDKTIGEYRKMHGDKVVVFDKEKASKIFDECGNSNDRRAVAYARNATFGIAQELGLRYFMHLDDDYSSFHYKFDENLNYVERPIRSLDSIINSLLDFYINTNAMTIAMAQNGDFIGGSNGVWAKDVRLHRKAMNTFICSVNRPFKFIGVLNEDVSTFIKRGSTGEIFLTIPNIAIRQAETQSRAGAITDIYLAFGTYMKSFYSVMTNPSCIDIAEMGHMHRRLHHRIRCNNAIPKIISEEFRKEDNDEDS